MAPNDLLSKSNKSLVLKKVNELVFEDRPRPEPKDGEVLIRVDSTGICGSDVHYWLEGAIGDFVVKDPMVLGHESAGTVAKLGKGVKNLKEGDRVAMEPGVPCRRCDYCKDGRYNLCPELIFAATPPYDGSLCGYYSLPEDFCVKLPDHVTTEEGALIEPLSVALNACRRADIKQGDSVIVTGAGPVGLLSCAVAKAFGARIIVSVDIFDAKVQFAKEYAATHTFIPSKPSDDDKKNKIAYARKQAEGIKKLDPSLAMGVNVIIECSGAEPSIQTGLLALRPGGKYVQVGMGAPEVLIPITALGTAEIDLKGSFRYGPGAYKLSVDLVADGKVNVKKLITHRFKFEDAPKAFEAVKKGGELEGRQVIKVQIHGIE